MPSAQDMVTEFHRAFDLPVGVRPELPSPERLRLRLTLMDEEMEEIYDEIGPGVREVNLATFAKELADMIYVTYGTAVECGVDLDAVIAEVHRSNMTKLDSDGKPFLRDDGKVLKGPFYTEADIEGALYG